MTTETQATTTPLIPHASEEFGKRLRSAIKHNDSDDGVGKEIYTWGFADAARLIESRKTTTLETGWLIEMRDKNGKPSWLRIDEAGFTDDSIKATRFCRKQDADATIYHLGSLTGLTATEHQWGN
ncbi:MAG: hypothetical protein WCD70_14910 [Alphaproteobacteria bacterium]